MMLTPVFKSADPMFNHRAAADAARLVMSMDEDEARSFTTMVVAEILWDDIEKNQKTLQRHLNEVVAKRIEMVAKAADRVVSKRGGEEQFGAALVEISKATRNPYDWGYVFNEADFSRDPRSGQFRAKVRYSTDKPVPDKIASVTPGLPNPKAMPPNLDNADRARFQQGYQQIASFLDMMQQSGVAADTKSYVTIRETKPGGRVYTREHTGTQVPTIDPATEAFVGIEARPVSLQVGGASFGLVSALGGGAYRAGQAGAVMEGLDRNVPTFADQWTAAGTGEGEGQLSNARLYGRVAAGSKFLANVAPAGSKLQMAGVFGEFVGTHGPQAEKVLGPHARASMYRYRGTEKKPDKDLIDPYDRLATGGYSLANLTPENRKKVETLQDNAVARYATQKGSKPTDQEIQRVKDNVLRRQFNVTEAQAREGAEIGRTRAIQHAQRFMEEKVPKPQLYDLQLKSGHTPPSEGIIIDKTGKITTQAIGYGDDHYLPFNLKNLKGLKDGEYIRTRSVGGPTTEDIYTGLISGARKLTVVSRSGTFTVEFDDTFRGTRRYNDKAKRMVDRYGKILDAIKSEQVERAPLPSHVRQEIADDVEREMGWERNPRAMAREIQRREAEYKEHPTLTKVDEELIERRVAREGGTDREKNELRSTLRNDVLEQRAFNYRLNGDGYAAAIDALREQFPYYIKETPHRPTREGRYESTLDRGYIKPRFNRPHGALEGYYETSINGEGTVRLANGELSGKFSADQVDFQNARGRLTREDRTPTTEEKPKEGEPTRAAAAVSQPATPAELAAHEIATSQQRQTLEDAAVALHKATAEAVPAGLNDQGKPRRGMMDEVLGMDEAAFRTWFKNAANQEKFRTLTEAGIKPIMPQRPELTELVSAYETARGELGGQPFNRASHLGTVPEQPYSFAEAPYMKGVDPHKTQAELTKVAQRTHVPDFGSLADLQHDADFKEALGKAHNLRRISAQLAQRPAIERAEFLRNLARNDPNVGLLSDEEKRLATQPERVDQMVEDINRAWALRKLLGPEAPEVEGGTLEPVTAQPAQAAPPPTPERTHWAQRPQRSLRAQAKDYSTALSRYARVIQDDNPGVAETLNDLASAFDAARYLPEDDLDPAFIHANTELISLMRDVPEYQDAINGAIMAELTASRRREEQQNGS